MSEFPPECECDDASKNDIIKWIKRPEQDNKLLNWKQRHKRVLLHLRLQDKQDQSISDPELDIFHN